MPGIFFAGGAAASSADRGHSLASFLPPPAAVGSLPIAGPVIVYGVSATWVYSQSDDVADITGAKAITMTEATFTGTYGTYNVDTTGLTMVVYAASFTKLVGSEKWTELVPLTKGTADANNYSGYGSANSFNTDTWLSDTGKSMKELARQ